MSTTGEFDAFGLTGKWAAAAESVIRLMTDGVSPLDLVLERGPGSDMSVERYAREYVNVNPRVSLAMVYGIASCGVCVAGQGGSVLLCPIKGGGFLEVPLIQHLIGVAPSGMRKSTALDAARRPLARALKEGVLWRRNLLREMRSHAERRAREALVNPEHPEPPRRGGIGSDIDRKQFTAIFTAGECPSTLLKDPTMEALRDFLISQGGVGGVWSAEADVYRNIAAYTRDTGSLTFLLDLWQQEGISTARVTSGLIQMEEVALVMAVLLQNDVFAEVTGGGGGTKGGGSDNFISRGMFGRNWVVRAPDVGGFVELAKEYTDEDDFNPLDADGMCDEHGNMTPLGDALIEYEDNLCTLVEQSNRYRMHKALRNEWTKAFREYGSDLQIEEPEDIGRHQIKLDQGARLAYRRVQRLQLAIEGALCSPMIEDDVRSVFNPLAARITQHIMREAFVMALGAGFREVTATMIEDAATRLFPWRVAHTADALLQRSQEIATESIARMTQQNPTLEDRSPDGAVLRALEKLASKEPGRRSTGYRQSEITATVRNAFADPKARRGVGEKVRSTLERLVNMENPVVTREFDGMDARKQPVFKYIYVERVSGGQWG